MLNSRQSSNAWWKKSNFHYTEFGLGQALFLQHLKSNQLTDVMASITISCIS